MRWALRITQPFLALEKASNFASREFLGPIFPRVEKVVFRALKNYDIHATAAAAVLAILKGKIPAVKTIITQLTGGGDETVC